MNLGKDYFPVSQLFARYQKSESVVYKRMKDLGIRSQKVGFRAYLNSAQLALLDDLHNYVQSGGTAAEFVVYKGLDFNT